MNNMTFMNGRGPYSLVELVGSKGQKMYLLNRRYFQGNEDILESRHLGYVITPGLYPMLTRVEPITSSGETENDHRLLKSILENELQDYLLVKSKKKLFDIELQSILRHT